MREIAHIRATMLGRFALQQTGMKEPQMVSLAGRSGRLWTLVAYLILHRDRGIPRSGTHRPSVARRQRQQSRQHSAK